MTEAMLESPDFADSYTDPEAARNPARSLSVNNVWQRSSLLFDPVRVVLREATSLCGSGLFSLSLRTVRGISS